MPLSEVYTCQCGHCQQETSHPDQDLHRQMNLLLSRLDEQQRRWYVAVESNRLGAGGDRLLAQITGLDEKNWPGSLRSDRSSTCDCPEEVGPAPKKRPSTRGSAGRFGAARNGRRS